MTREEYVALNRELMHDKISLEGQLRRTEAEIKKIDQNPDKKEELAKLKKEEAEIKKELALVKEKMTKNYEARKQAESKTIASKVKDYGKERLEKAKAYKRQYEIVRNVSKAVMEGASVYKGAPDIHLRPQPQVVVESIKHEEKVEEKLIRKSAKLKEAELLNKASKRDDNKNDAEKKQEEIERAKRIEEIMKKKEEAKTKSKTL
ncbi:MAG: hypothetical protein JNL51_14930 [Chitinophagaceae bacterium]|nr:hypothetical protein [Chitinophagaceae bacterium]